MKKLLFLTLFCFTFLHTQSPQALFERANALYKSEKYEPALKLYKKIPNKSAHTHYNMGNCAYRLGQKGYALLYWRRAEKNWGIFNREELLQNIALLKKQNVAVSLLRSTPLFLLQFLFLILWIFLFLYIRFLYKRRKHHTIIILFALIAFFGVLLAIRYTVDSRRYGIIVTKSAALRSGPGETFQTLLTIPEATEVVIKRDLDGAYKVKALKQIGYVQKGDVERI